jgi:hypothetical protein
MAPFGENSDAAFQPWTADQQHAPKCWDVKRLLAVPTPERREKAWRAKRRHAPCSNRIPPEWGLDCIYLRYREEAGYAQRLSSLLQHPPQMALEGVSLELVCLERPLLPFRWPRLSRPTGDPVREFPVQGSLQIPGEDVPRDSAYALFRSSGLGGLGDPGRFIREFKREKRDRRRNFFGVLVPSRILRHTNGRESGSLPTLTRMVGRSGSEHLHVSAVTSDRNLPWEWPHPRGRLVVGHFPKRVGCPRFRPMVC